jgi:hypothetical protein
MGFFDSLQKPKSKGSIVTKEKGLSRALTATLEKAKAQGGDPFSEYRRKRVLPEKFEYGMNCFLDRIFESQGEEVAQKTYEELKKMGGCTLEEGTSSVDVAGIPVLFGVRNLAIGIDAQNRAIERMRREKQLTKPRVDKSAVETQVSKYLQRLERETDYEYTFRLSAIGGGLNMTSLIFLEQGLKFLEQGKYTEYTESINMEPHASLLKPYAEAIEQMVSSIHCHEILDDKETEKLLLAAGAIGMAGAKAIVLPKSK